VAVGAIEPPFYANLCRRLGCEQWLAHQTDDAAQEKVRADFAAAFRTRDRDDWVAELSAADTCVAAVLTVPELVDDAQFAARGAFVEAQHPDHGTFRQVGPTFAGTTAAPDGPYEVRDATVTDTDELLQAAGFTEDECAELRKAGVIA
jgi:alpha-methylacyl-CoA racemase